MSALQRNVWECIGETRARKGIRTVRVPLLSLKKLACRQKKERESNGVNTNALSEFYLFLFFKLSFLKTIKSYTHTHTLLCIIV